MKKRKKNRSNKQANRHTQADKHVRDKKMEGSKTNEEEERRIRQHTQRHLSSGQLREQAVSLGLQTLDHLMRTRRERQRQI
jgi:hypothetical protein